MSACSWAYLYVEHADLQGAVCNSHRSTAVCISLSEPSNPTRLIVYPTGMLPFVSIISQTCVIVCVSHVWLCVWASSPTHLWEARWAVCHFVCPLLSNCHCVFLMSLSIWASLLTHLWGAHLSRTPFACPLLACCRPSFHCPQVLVAGGLHKADTQHVSVLITNLLWRRMPVLQQTIHGVGETVCMHRIWPYIWWFFCQKHYILLYILVLANPTYTHTKMHMQGTEK